jgi:hypothetical protein
MAATVTILEQKISFLQADLDSRKLTGCKRVKMDPNQVFARIEDIHEARVVAERRAEQYGADIKADAEDIGQLRQEDMEGQFHLQDTDFE